MVAPTDTPTVDPHADYKTLEDCQSYFPLFMAHKGLNVDQIPQNPILQRELSRQYFEWRERQP